LHSHRPPTAANLIGNSPGQGQVTRQHSVCTPECEDSRDPSHLMADSAALAERPAAAIVAHAPDPKPPSYATREQRRDDQCCRDDDPSVQLETLWWAGGTRPASAAPALSRSPTSRTTDGSSTASSGISHIGVQPRYPQELAAALGHHGPTRRCSRGTPRCLPGLAPKHSEHGSRIQYALSVWDLALDDIESLGRHDDDQGKIQTLSAYWDPAPVLAVLRG